MNDLNSSDATANFHEADTTSIIQRRYDVLNFQITVTSLKSISKLLRQYQKIQKEVTVWGKSTRLFTSIS